MTDADRIEGTVAQRIRQVRHSLAPGELRVVAALTDAYPTAGLVPIAQLAADADVSAPTALRLVSKLGFAGYGAFQEALRDEVQTRLFSPVAVYPTGEATTESEESDLSTAARIYSEGLRSTIENLASDDLDDAVRALADTDRTIMIVGGRFTTVLATQLHQYLRMLRPAVRMVMPTSADHLASLIDVDENTVAVVFDHRRYQQTTIEWGESAADRGASLVLVTDVYLSPLASRATSVLTVSHAGPGPFDSMAHGFMLVELLVAMLITELGEPARDRLAEFEEMALALEQPPNRRRRR
ncbi:MurR/RpiR family transcriptional regulator [Gordonia sp. NPDC003504]